MLKINKFIISGFVCLFLTGHVALAEGKKNMLEGKHDSPSSAALDNIRLANRLAIYGDKENDPLALIMAAKIKKMTPTRTKNFAKENAMTEMESKKNEKAQDVKSLLFRAKTMAANRNDLIALADDVAAMNVRARSAGPFLGETKVAKKDSDIFSVEFKGGEEAGVLIVGDGDTDLDLYIYDDDGDLICASEGNSDEEACVWVPRYTSTFKIRVKNRGKVYNKYSMLIP